MVLKVSFNNISVISWLLVVLVEETGVPGENLYFHLCTGNLFLPKCMFLNFQIKCVTSIHVLQDNLIQFFLLQSKVLKLWHTRKVLCVRIWNILKTFFF
jgi:hypothetical protein